MKMKILMKVSFLIIFISLRLDDIESNDNLTTIKSVLNHDETDPESLYHAENFEEVMKYSENYDMLDPELLHMTH